LEISINGARGILFNITGGDDMTMSEVNEAAQVISQAADPDANIIFGAAIDDKMGDEIKISVIATGFDENYGGAKLYGTTLSRSLTMNPLISSVPQPSYSSASDTSYTDDQSDSNDEPIIEQPELPKAPADQPPTQPIQAQPTISAQNNQSTDPVEDEFDIPAFLRRK